MNCFLNIILKIHLIGYIIDRIKWYFILRISILFWLMCIKEGVEC